MDSIQDALRVRFWGTRGSIAAPGPGTVRYGGNTSCVEVRTADGTLLVLDAGTGLRALGDALLADDRGTRRGHILITHTHWDHIQGFPFCRPLFLGGWEWDVYAPRGFGRSLRDTLAGQMQYTYFPVALDSLGAVLRYHDLVEGEFRIGDLRIVARYLNHPALTLGYRIEAGGTVLVYATDHECFSPASARLGKPLGALLGDADARERRHAEFVAGADLLIHDAQYTAAEYPERVGWGHSTVEYVTRLAVESGVRQLALFHHDPRRDDAEVDRLLASAQAWAREAGSDLRITAAAEGETLTLRPGSRMLAPIGGQPAAMGSVATIEGRSALIVGGDPALATRLGGVAESEGLKVTWSPAPSAGQVEAQDWAIVLLLQDLDRGAAAFVDALRARAGARDLPVIQVGEPPESSSDGRLTDHLALPFSDEYARTKVRAWLLRAG